MDGLRLIDRLDPLEEALVLAIREALLVHGAKAPSVCMVPGDVTDAVRKEMGVGYDHADSDSR